MAADEEGHDSEAVLLGARIRELMAEKDRTLQTLMQENAWLKHRLEIVGSGGSGMEEPLNQFGKCLAELQPGRKLEEDLAEDIMISWVESDEEAVTPGGIRQPCRDSSFQGDARAPSHGSSRLARGSLRASRASTATASTEATARTSATSLLPVTHMRGTTSGKPFLAVPKSRGTTASTSTTSTTSLSYDGASLRGSTSAAVFSVAEVWTEDAPITQLASDMALNLSVERAAPTRGSLGRSIREGPRSLRNRLGLPLGPNSNLKIAWDFVGLLFISYDLIAIPLMVFDPPDSPFTEGFGWVSLLFWTMDMVASNLVVYVDGSDIVTSQKRITLHYLKTWFVLDLIAVLPDWIIRISQGASSGNMSAWTRILRGVRAMRIFRLLRLLKLRKLVNALFDIIDSDYMFVIFGTVRLVVTIAVTNHIIACAWYVVGMQSQQLGLPCWLDEIEVHSADPSNLNWRYTSALHWSITQFTPASINVVARNTTERTVSVLVLTFAVFVFTSIIGSVSSAIDELRQINGDLTKEFWMLRKFLKQSKVDADVSRRMVKFLLYHTSRQNAEREPDLWILDSLSMPLNDRLAFEMLSANLVVHPLFAFLRYHSEPVMIKISVAALQCIHFGSEDIIFRLRESSNGMVMLFNGECQYTLPSGDGMPLKNGSWLAEASIWTDWLHRGNLKAYTPCYTGLIEAQKFVAVMRVHPYPWTLSCRYAARFVQFLNRIDQKQLIDILSTDAIMEEGLDAMDGTLWIWDRYERCWEER
eukprot:TRINITY_DN102815_c0_g1_i1.p1 TRINITY_DN102815_c0_g1~~TRINITY_DN102815_c0_g1_i1.p1  ORF type:complete len:767 (+),score=101.17 TRINITY_DN102815_c0_g1_i1:29-2302(+)